MCRISIAVFARVMAPPRRMCGDTPDADESENPKALSHPRVLSFASAPYVEGHIAGASATRASEPDADADKRARARVHFAEGRPAVAVDTLYDVVSAVHVGRTHHADIAG